MQDQSGLVLIITESRASNKFFFTAILKNNFMRLTKRPHELRPDHPALPVTLLTLTKTSSNRLP